MPFFLEGTSILSNSCKKKNYCRLEKRSVKYKKGNIINPKHNPVIIHLSPCRESPVAMHRLFTYHSLILSSRHRSRWYNSAIKLECTKILPKDFISNKPILWISRLHTYIKSSQIEEISFHPTSLSTCLCKKFGIILNKRLLWHLEK